MGYISPFNIAGTAAMTPLSTYSPVSLSYIAALRGHVPKMPGLDFTYADAHCREPARLICLAASNPEGRFYGFVADENMRRLAENEATQRGTFNIAFLVGSPGDILARIDQGAMLPPMLDYLCYDDSCGLLSAFDREALYDLAAKRLNDGGTFTLTYRAYDQQDGALRFLVREMATEMSPEQKVEFLSDIKHLGSLFLSRCPSIAAQLDTAIVARSPDSFLTMFDTPVTATTFDTLVAMGSRDMLYGGDANLPSNYVVMSVPAEAQNLITQCRDNPLYECIKDFALDRQLRTDIWVKTPSSMSSDPAALFGGFAYGIIVPRDQVPTSYAAQGRVIDLSTPLYTKLADLMAAMPMGISDVLSHPECEGETAESILDAIQILVACGIAHPMRGARSEINVGSVAQPRLVGNYNRYIDKTSLDEDDVWMASQIMGCGVAVSAREAFVMQALNRAGLSNSVSALMPELLRLAHTPASMSVVHAETVTAELAQSMVRDVVGESLPTWYAYALLEAA